MTTASELRRLGLFAGVPENDLAAIADLLQETTVSAGTMLVSAEIPEAVVYFIVSGSVQVRFTDDDGRYHVVAVLGPGDLVGELAPHPPAIGVDVIARQRTRLFWIEGRAFQRCLDISAMLCRNLVRELAERLRLAEQQCRSLVTLGVSGRIAANLLELAERYGRPRPGQGIQIPMPLTRGELGDMVGSTLARTDETLESFERSGIIGTDPEHRITILRPEVLTELRHL